MRKIGIMGGTFNPIHNGHLAIAKKAREQFLLEKVLFMPSGVPYMKNLQNVLPASVRCEMTALAIADMPYFELSDIEVSDAECGKNTYTFETLEKLRRADPTAEYYFILGADSLQAIEHWKKPERIFQNCTILAAVREKEDTGKENVPDAVHGTDQGAQNLLQKSLASQAQYLQKKFHASIALLEISDIPVSSTQIRSLLSAGRSIHGLVPEAVEAYILYHHLYKFP